MDYGGVEMRLLGKTALVTGGGTGIGKGLALALGREGADVAVTYYTSARGADEVADELRALGRSALTIKANLALVAEAQQAVAAAVETFGRLDVLVYNAGLSDPHPFLELTEEEYDATLDVNLKGAYFCAQAAARAMIAGGVGGSMVLVSSVHGTLSQPGFTHYAASKAGLEQLVRTVANELAPHGVRVNAVAPGMIEVERYFRTMPDYVRETWGKTVPLGRVGFPSDIAGAVVFLVSDDADFITGITIRVDGGALTRHPHFPPGTDTTYPNRRPGRGEKLAHTRR